MWAYKPVNSPAFSYIFTPLRKAMRRRATAASIAETPNC